MGATNTISLKERIEEVVFSAGFIGIHLACLLVIWAGVSPIAVVVCVLSYYARMFGLTAGYHRYFSHRTFKAGRGFQFFLAFLGATAVQKGPLWWAAHHRHHHRFSDTEEDVHSPVTGGVWWSHVGWIFSRKSKETRYALIPDLVKYPELRFINDYHLVAAGALIAFLYALGWALETWAPGLGTNGFQLVVWGFFISTSILYHGTFTVNSLAHLFGKRRFNTTDDSRNSFLIALITMGEGWHNNHHRYLASERQGFYWWEIDMSHYILKMFSWVGLVRDIRVPPEKIYEEAEQGRINGVPPFRRRTLKIRESAAQTRRAVLEHVEDEPALAED